MGQLGGLSQLNGFGGAGLGAGGGGALPIPGGGVGIIPGLGVAGGRRSLLQAAASATPDVAGALAAAPSMQPAREGVAATPAVASGGAQCRSVTQARAR